MMLGIEAANPILAADLLCCSLFGGGLWFPYYMISWHNGLSVKQLKAVP